MQPARSPNRESDRSNGLTEYSPLLGNAPLRGSHRRESSNDREQRNSISALELSKHHNQRYFMPPLPQHQPHMGPPPFYHMFLSTKYTVSNPLSSTHDLSGLGDGISGNSADIESDTYGVNPYRRMSILNALRPERLIGNYQPPAQWASSFVPDLRKVSSRLRNYYEEQNHLIEKCIEIDNFLDYGKVHLNMLTTYTDSHNKLVPLLEEPSSPLSDGPDASALNSKSRLNAVPGNISEGGQFLGHDEEQSARDVFVAILVNFAVNFVLLVGKIAVSILTNSLSVVASLVDSVLDFLSTFIIYIANRLSNTMNWRTQIAYPIGRTKLEPLGILIFSVIIIISFFQVGLESFKKLFLSSSSQHTVVTIGFDAIAIMLLTIFSKVLCWWWCVTSKSSSVQALAQDAMTDIVFNTVSLISPTIGYYANIWWLDPAGALLLSVYIIVSWSFTAFEHIDNLTGAVASPADYKTVLYMAYRFAECIKQITALKVYHVGDNLNVEIDIVFDTEAFDMTFKDAHDIAEALQYALETLPMVERAFVHIDYMVGNFKGHLK